MKSIIAIVLLTLTLSSQASYSVVNALCENDRGVELEIKLSNLERWPAPHELTISMDGNVVQHTLLNEHFGMDQYDFNFSGTIDRNGSEYEVFVMIDMNSQMVVYQEVANGGISPLPASIYETCVIEAGF